MKLLQTAVRLVTAVFFLNSSMALAQIAQAPDVPDPGSRFARATITAHDERKIPSMLFDIYGDWIVKGTPLVTIISVAYDIPAFQIVDGPDWFTLAGLAGKLARELERTVVDTTGLEGIWMTNVELDDD